jgi:hypothetical protein
VKERDKEREFDRKKIKKDRQTDMKGEEKKKKRLK